MRRPSTALLAILLALAAPVHAAEPDKPRQPTLELSAEASVEAPNDLASAQAYAEATGPSAAALATQINKTIAAALETARSFPTVKVRSGGTHTGPIYASGRLIGGRAEIEGWRMRSSLVLESRDPAALAALIGKLQGSLAVAEMNFRPAPETRRQAEDAALVEALKHFEARAKLAAGTLGRRYRIAQVSISTQGMPPPGGPIYRAAMAQSEAAPAPVQAGESSVVVQVSGSVELID